MSHRILKDGVSLSKGLFSDAADTVESYYYWMKRWHNSVMDRAETEGAHRRRRPLLLLHGVVVVVVVGGGGVCSIVGVGGCHHHHGTVVRWWWWFVF